LVQPLNPTTTTTSNSTDSSDTDSAQQVISSSEDDNAETTTSSSSSSASPADYVSSQADVLVAAVFDPVRSFRVFGVTRGGELLAMVVPSSQRTMKCKVCGSGCFQMHAAWLP
jgi:hypothetical protein